MQGESEFSTTRPAPWLEVLDGSSPILLIAPHGGRAGPASRLRANPKVNDLYTAQITRALAASLSASALINAGMDRNQLDCNRLGQLIEHAPWLLDIIAERVAAIAAKHGRAIVLVIHGWNIIEPRIDFGLGARLKDGNLTPAGSAHISASDEFVNCTVAGLAERMRRDGIIPSFGYRYPAGGFHNLLQAFTPRHLESPSPALRDLAAMAARRAIDAVQLELSVAVRMPGTIRERALDAIGAAFSGDAVATPAPNGATPITVVRTAKPKAPVSSPSAGRAGVPARVGIEFYDPAAGVGAMAGFDLGPMAIGARIMMLLERRRVALFTTEGIARRDGGRIALGPLALHAGDREVTLQFNGPVVVVPDGTAYLSIERALASGALDEAAEVSARLELKGARLNLEELLADGASAQPPADWAAAFGRLTGAITIDGNTRQLDAVGRVGMSFTGLGSARFSSRRTVWAYFPDSAAHAVLQAGVITNDDGTRISRARVLGERGWTQCELEQLELDTASVDTPPEKISATVTVDGSASASLRGEVHNFVPLSRPGPNQSRIYTSLGFATFQLGAYQGAGMFEYSRRSEPLKPARANDADEDAD